MDNIKNSVVNTVAVRFHNSRHNWLRQWNRRLTNTTIQCSRFKTSSSKNQSFPEGGIPFRIFSSHPFQKREWVILENPKWTSSSRNVGLLVRVCVCACVYDCTHILILILILILKIEQECVGMCVCVSVLPDEACFTASFMSHTTSCQGIIVVISTCNIHRMISY